jgi:hypothetical protein
MKKSWINSEIFRGVHSEKNKFWFYQNYITSKTTMQGRKFTSLSSWRMRPKEPGKDKDSGMGLEKKAMLG